MKNNRIINDFFCRKHNIFFVFPAGFFFGLFLGMVFGKKEIIGKMIVEMIKIMQDTTLYYPVFFFYVIKERFKHLFFILVCMMVPFGPYAFYGWFTCIFISFGFVLSAFFCNYGFVGVIVVMVSFFPHALFYGLALFWGYDYLHEIWNKKSVGDHIGQFKTKRHINIKNIKINKIYAIFLVAIIGIISECYVNPFIIKLFLNFLK